MPPPHPALKSMPAVSKSKEFSPMFHCDQLDLMLSNQRLPLSWRNVASFFDFVGGRMADGICFFYSKTVYKIHLVEGSFLLGFLFFFEGGRHHHGLHLLRKFMPEKLACPRFQNTQLSVVFLTPKTVSLSLLSTLAPYKCQDSF